MKPKVITTVALLAFVALSVGFLIFKEAVSPDGAATEIGTVTGGTHTVVAYYFYGNVRCQTCRKLEAYTSESITTTFTNELADGRLQWKTANVDEKENEHFIKDYELTSRSVVLVDMVDGKQANWKNLGRIWDLVGDKAEFQKYIADETTGFLKKEKM